MAGDWIPMRLDLDRDPAVVRVAADLDKPVLWVVGALWRLWSWANAQSSDGELDVPSEWVDEQLIGCHGFVTAMSRRGWLEVGQDGVIRLPNYEHWNGSAAKVRLQSALRKRRSRSVTQNGADVSRSERDKSASRGEERRVKPPHPPRGGQEALDEIIAEARKENP